MAGVTAQRTRRATAAGIPPALRGHVVTSGNDGRLAPDTTQQDLDAIFDKMKAELEKMDKKRVVLYAHGGLVDQATGISRAGPFTDSFGKVAYPLSFVWGTGLWETLSNIVKDVVFSLGIIPFSREELDNDIEDLTRGGGGIVWGEMKENAERAWLDADEGAEHAGAAVLRRLEEVATRHPDLQVHVIGHSAGSIFLAPFVQAWTRKRSIATCTMWAPACTLGVFRDRYAPAIRSGSLQQFRLYTLSRQMELDDSCGIYGKSLLHWISRAFEPDRDPMALLGLEAFVREDAEILDLVGSRWIVPPQPSLTTAIRHQDFDDDGPTLASTRAAIGAA